MADFPGRLRPPVLAAGPGSPAVGEIYYDSALNVQFYWNGTVWVPTGSAINTGPMTLPSSGLVNGQRMVYRLASNAIYSTPTKDLYWDLVWNGGVWNFVGGQPMTYNTGVTDVVFSTGSVWTAHPACKLTVPEKGVYMVEAFASAWAPTVAESVSMRVDGVSGGGHIVNTQDDVTLAIGYIGPLVCGPTYLPGVLDKASLVVSQFFCPQTDTKIRYASLKVTPVYILA